MTDQEYELESELQKYELELAGWNFESLEWVAGTCSYEKKL